MIKILAFANIASGSASFTPSPPPPPPSVGRRYHLSEKKYTLFFCACRICRGTFSSRYQDFSRYPAYGHLKQLGKKRSSLEEKKSALETTTITKTTIPHPHPHPPPTHTHKQTNRKRVCVCVCMCVWVCGCGCVCVCVCV